MLLTNRAGLSLKSLEVINERVHKRTHPLAYHFVYRFISQGEVGSMGTQGPQGTQGIQGPAGPNGQQGDDGIGGDDVSFHFNSLLVKRMGMRSETTWNIQAELLCASTRVTVTLKTTRK